MEMLAGLYKKEDQALLAYRALLANGFQEQDLTLLVRKEVKPPQFPKSASPRQVAVSAVAGALLFGTLGLILALLIGFGVIALPGLMPNFEPGNVRMTLSLGIALLFVSALIGTLLGAAIRLIRSADQAAITEAGVRRGGLLLVVNVGATRRAAAEKLLQENGAVDIENLSETWDPEVWGRYKRVENNVV